MSRGVAEGFSRVEGERILTQRRGDAECAEGFSRVEHVEGDGSDSGGSVAPRRSNEEWTKSLVKRRLLVRRGATDPLVDVCRNRRSIINRSRNEVPFTAIHKRAKQ